MKAIHKRRLLKLARHLERGKMGHRKFDFAGWNLDEFNRQLRVNGCGYSGCAIGECPIVFPTLWAWNNGFPVVRRTLASTSTGSGMEFFGLKYEAFQHLFMPFRQRPSIYGGLGLTPHATRNEVACNIRAFIRRKEKEAHNV